MNLPFDDFIAIPISTKIRQNDEILIELKILKYFECWILKKTKAKFDFMWYWKYKYKIFL